MSRVSCIPHGIAITGEIRGQGDLVVGGTVEGPIAIDGHLTIEETGVVRGEAKARAIVIRGRLYGPALADETIRIEPGARVIGDARAERVSVVEGALLRGRITMTGALPPRRSSAGAITAPRSSAGVPIAPRDDDEGPREDRSLQSDDPPVPSSAEPVRVPARDRRPPEPVIFAVGRQRARRKDGGRSW
jgi:cytoskeletal protein CcmA (bactofilin family)